MIIMIIIMIFFILIPILTLPLSRVQECQRQLEFRLVLAGILWISRMNDPSVQEPPIRDDTRSCLCQNVEFSENTLLVDEGHRALDGRCLLRLRILNCAEFPSLDHAISCLCGTGISAVLWFILSRQWTFAPSSN